MACKMLFRSFAGLTPPDTGVGGATGFGKPCYIAPSLSTVTLGLPSAIRREARQTGRFERK